MDANLTGNLHVTGNGDHNLTETTVSGQLDISTIDGNINSDGTLTGESLDVNAIDGDVGSKESPLETDVNKIDAQGNNVYINNAGDTEIGNITADENLGLDVDGDITASDDTKPNISAGDATIDADGNIGSKKDPIDTNVDNFHGSGENIYIDNHSPNLDVTDVEAEKITINTDGNITGEDITTGDITINAGDNVGTEDDPFTFWADGKVSIKAGLSILNYKNLYIPEREAGSVFAEYYELVFVLGFDIEINGEEKALYMLIAVDEEGRLILLGMVIGDRETDEAFWTAVLNVLRNELGILKIGNFFIDDITGFEGAMTETYEEAMLWKISDLLASEAVAAEEKEDISEWNEDLMQSSVENAVSAGEADDNISLYNWVMLGEVMNFSSELENWLTEQQQADAEAFEDEEKLLKACAALMDVYTIAETFDFSDPIVKVTEDETWFDSAYTGYAVRYAGPEAELNRVS